MKFVLLHAGTAREDWATAATSLYVKKISAFFPISEEAVKPKRAARDEAALKRDADSDSLLAAIKPDDLVMLFDEKGEALDSRAFAKRIDHGLSSSKKRIIFVIGGAYGVSEVMRRRADRTISLGAMTLNHLLAKIVALEQIYRALTILRGLPYHND